MPSAVSEARSRGTDRSGTHSRKDVCHVHRTAGSHGSVSAPHHQPVYTVSMDGTRRCPGCQLRSLSHVPASRPRRLREVLSRTFCDLDWTTQLAAGSHARLTARKVKERRVTPGLHPSCRVPVAAALHRRMRNTTGWPASSHFRAPKPEPPPGGQDPRPLPALQLCPSTAGWSGRRGSGLQSIRRSLRELEPV